MKLQPSNSIGIVLLTCLLVPSGCSNAANSPLNRDATIAQVNGISVDMREFELFLRDRRSQVIENFLPPRRSLVNLT